MLLLLARMRIGCLQFAPRLGEVENNLSEADDILSEANPEDLDLLVLPELAFSGTSAGCFAANTLVSGVETRGRIARWAEFGRVLGMLLTTAGYNFKSLHEIYPFLEPTVSGITSVWAKNAALRYDCAVAVGYPETADVSHKWPTSPEYYNALIVVNRDGDTWAHYRKSHLYYTDESWALEGDGFWKGFMPGIGKVALGICKLTSSSLDLPMSTTDSNKKSNTPQAWTSSTSTGFPMLLVPSPDVNKVPTNSKHHGTSSSSPPMR